MFDQYSVEITYLTGQVTSLLVGTRTAWGIRTATLHAKDVWTNKTGIEATELKQVRVVPADVVASEDELAKLPCFKRNPLGEILKELQSHPFPQTTSRLNRKGVNMSRSLIHQISTQPAAVKVYRDSETKEFVVRLYKGGKLYEPADYFTDDRADAIGTAEAMIDHELKQRGARVMNRYTVQLLITKLDLKAISFKEVKAVALNCCIDVKGARNTKELIKALCGHLKGLA